MQMSTSQAALPAPLIDLSGLPAAVRMLLFWRVWSRSTEWYAWKVRP